MIKSLKRYNNGDLILNKWFAIKSLSLGGAPESNRCRSSFYDH